MAKVPVKKPVSAPKPNEPSADAFKQALAAVLIHEGGKVDHAKDPGGRTNKGVTQRVYNAWRGKSNLPNRDVYDISDSEVEAIYRFQYWDAVKGDLLPKGVSYVVFDGAVNSGPKQSVKWLQRALGVTADGVLGSVTLDALSNVNDNDTLIARICDRRMLFLQALKTWPTFGKGWSRRVDSVEKTGQAWASGSVGPKIVAIEGANAKAPIEDAKTAPKKGFSDTATGAGVGAGGIGAALQTAQESLTPLSVAGDWIGTMVAILVIAGVVIAVGGFAYRLYATRKEKELEDALDVQPT
jgi:lysozyme family protein